MGPDEPSIQIELEPCGICGRTFAPKVLQKHETICQKQQVKKRKPFNSLAQRVAGTDLADFHMPTYLKKSGNEDEGNETNASSTDIAIPDTSVPKNESEVKKSGGREKGEKSVVSNKVEKPINKPSLIEETPVKGNENIQTKSTMKIVKEDLSVIVKDKHNTVTPKRSTTSLRDKMIALASQGEKCPSCGRSFGEKAFERHVEWCKERNQNRSQPSPAALQMAKERLAARQNYKAPILLAKSQRQINKEKYSHKSYSKQNSSEDENTSSVPSPTSLIRSPSIRRESDTATPNGLKRGNSIRRPSAQSISRKPESPAHNETRHNILENSKHGRQKKLSRGKSPPINSSPNLLEGKTSPALSQHSHDRQESVSPSISSTSLKSPTTSYLKRSVPVVDPVAKPKHMKNKNDVEKYLHGKDNKKKSHPEEGNFTAEDLFDVDDELYAEYKQYEEMYLKEKQRKSSGREQLSGVMGSNGEKISRDKSQSPDNKCDVKPSGDSAYSSLNRSSNTKEHPNRGSGDSEHIRKKSSTVNEEEQQRCHSSSSGSDVSIPVVSRKKKSTAIHKSLLNSVANPQFDSNEFNTQINDHNMDPIVNYTLGRRKNSETPIENNSENITRRNSQNITRQESRGNSLRGSLDNLHQRPSRNSSIDDLNEAVNDDSHSRKTSIEGQQRLPKFCHECGSKYPVSVAKFCVECGAKRLVL